MDRNSLQILIELSLSQEQKMDCQKNAIQTLVLFSSHYSVVPYLLEVKIWEVCKNLVEFKEQSLFNATLEMICNLIQNETAKDSIFPELAVVVSREYYRMKKIESELSPSDLQLLKLLNEAVYVCRLDEKLRLKIEVANPEFVLTALPSFSAPHTSLINRLVVELSDTDEKKVLSAARNILSLMEKQGLEVKKEILKHKQVFSNLWKLVKICKLGWEDHWYTIIDPSKLKFKEEIGVGSFATVYRGTLKTKNKKIKVAIKTMDESLVNLSDFKCELATLSLLNGIVENMIFFYGYLYLSQKSVGVMKLNKKYHCIVTEIMDFSLEQALYEPKAKQNLKLEDIKKIAFQIAVGMAETHSYNILHRDLKPANILLSTNKNDWIVKIADFGYARRDSKESLRKSVVGTPAYLAPELLNVSISDSVDAACDVYSFGVILWEMLSKKRPFESLVNQNFVFHILSLVERNLPIFEIPENSDPFLGSIMQKCVNPNPSKRPSFAQLQKIILNG